MFLYKTAREYIFEVGESELRMSGKSVKIPQHTLLQFRFSCFAVLLAISGYIHHLNFGLAHESGVFGYLHYLAIFLLITKPGSLRFFVFYLLSSWATLFVIFERLANHLVFECIVTCTLLAVFAYSVAKERSLPSSTKFYARFAPLARTQLLILYSFAFLAKLNTDFFKTSVSCANRFLHDIASFFHLQQLEAIRTLLNSQTTSHCIIGGTVLVEGLIPLLLAIRKTRNFGVLLGIVFHLTMGLVPALGVSSFSNLAFAFLFLFLSDDAAIQLERLVQRYSPLTKASPNRVLAFEISLAIFAFVSIWIQFTVFDKSLPFLITIWIIIATSVACLLIAAILISFRHPSSQREPSAPQKVHFTVLPKWLFVMMLAPILVNGLAPYLALKTQTSFTMYSNLRTLGPKPNHLIIPPSLRLFDRELVELVAADHPYFDKYLNRPILLSTFSVRRLIEFIPDDFEATFIYRGEMITIGRENGILSNHLLTQPLSWSERKFLRFREISSSEDCECAW